MLAVAFDTLKLAKKLERDGMPAKQAESFAASLSETLTEWHSVGNLATKDDLLKLEIKIAALDTKMSDVKADIIKWMLGQNALILLAIFGLVHSMAK